MTLDFEPIGKRICNLRRDKNITQEQLAELVNLSVTQINKLENGKSRLSLDSLVNIATVLEASTDEILFGRIKAGADHRYDEVLDIFTDCDKTELRILMETSRRIKELLREDEKKKG